MSQKQPHNPELLPLQNLDWGRLVTLLGDAHEEVARFDALLGNVPDAGLLLSPLTTREAVLSSRIEGTQATLEEVLRFQAEGKAEPDKRNDIVEVINHRRAMDFSMNKMESLPLSGRLLRAAHKILLSDARGKQKDPGNFRSGAVFIGKPGATMKQARYIPPEATRIPELFSNLEKYMHGEEKDVLVQLAIVHAQFEIIHPFWDGNGRIGRLLLPLFLHHKKAIANPYFYLSEYLEKNRDKYYNGLNLITQRGDWEQWIEFFLLAVTVQSRANAKQAQEIISLKEKTMRLVQEATRSHYALQITNFICANPIFSGADFRDRATIPRASTSRLLGRLENKGIVEKLLSGKGARTTIWNFTELNQMLHRVT